jgi:hypothetical protein
VWRDEGLTLEDIARRIGCTVGTLRVRCSQFGILLRRRAAFVEKCESPSHSITTGVGNGLRRRAALKRSSAPSRRKRLTVSVSPAALQQLRTCATSKGVPDAFLAAALLEKIAEDNLYDAVLDGVQLITTR